MALTVQVPALPGFQRKSLIYRATSTVVLANGASGVSDTIPCDGAKRVVICARCDVNHQLTVANVVLTMVDGRTVTATPAAYPNGAQATGTLIKVMGPIIALDLSAATFRALTLADGEASIAQYPYGILGGLAGVHLALTKAATPGDATYTFLTSVYD